MRRRSTGRGCLGEGRCRVSLSNLTMVLGTRTPVFDLVVQRRL
ncbi:MAG: hypothetical protein AVDCRST_MAG19-2729 [uncultured Thermomicrobiales bacterium]|uniref:Uncharacterized protein n=1 Tax=uncultured Thermomicrobiales bacterium TaxID=1645740 RepID=A0A6J4VA49_9BACT|nr:MAG: hypothetical protein AVDCRST_MAG19-2729 [uncultured Thermomicrobiales bacterium]